jgi:hypothetical protein
MRQESGEYESAGSEHDGAPSHQIGRRPLRGLSWWSIAAIGIILASAFVVRARGLDSLLTGGEVDYVRAAQRGFLVNYLDQGSRPIGEYLAAARAMAGLSHDDSGGDPDLWQRDAVARDIAAYRHYHPPLFIYALNLTERAFGFSEVALRLVPLLLACATIATLFLGSAWLLPDGGVRIGLVAAAILSTLSLHVSTSTDIGWHVPYASVATVALFSMGNLLVRPSVTWLLVTAAVITLAFAVLEHAVFLALTLVVLLLTTANPWLRIARTGIFVHPALAAAVGVSVLTLLVVWPASLLKLSVVKNLGVHAYYSRTLELSPNFHDVYLTLMTRYPVMAALAVFTALVLARRRYRLHPALLPFVVYPLTMCLLQLGNVNLKPLYFVSWMPPLALLAAFCLVRVMDEAAQHRPRVVPLAIAFLTCGVAFVAARSWAAPHRPAPHALLTERLSASDALVGERVLTWPPGNHLVQTLGFYLPDTKFYRAVNEPDEVRRFQVALQRGVFPVVIVERDGDAPLPGDVLLRQAYAPFAGLDGVPGFEVWRRRE